jgi:hypothetical protein
MHLIAKLIYRELCEREILIYLFRFKLCIEFLSIRILSISVNFFLIFYCRMDVFKIEKC